MALSEQRTALISDIHGYYHGLLLALADARAVGCDRVLCLGDLVDGGEENDEVVRAMRDRRILTVRGNHDEPNALTLAPDVADYLAALPEALREEDVVYTHISPRAKKSKIIDIYEAWNVFGETEARLIFVGHAHIPMLFGERCDHACQATAYSLIPNVPFALDPQDRYIFCVGAIGYSRDGIPKPRYGIYDAAAGTVESRTIEASTLPLG